MSRVSVRPIHVAHRSSGGDDAGCGVTRGTRLPVESAGQFFHDGLDSGPHLSYKLTHRG